MKHLVSLFMLFACVLMGRAQTDLRPVVGVAQFTSDEQSPYCSLVTEKVVEMLTNTRRFRVVDRTSIDKVHEELELQKTEAFLDSKNRVEQDAAVAAEQMITGHIIKVPVYRIKNNDGSVRGYKASVAFQMKVVDVATGISTEATSFEGKASKECMSPESAVTMAMQSLQEDIYEYFHTNFPVKAKVHRILSEKKGAAQIVLLSAGKQQGIKIGDKFTVDVIETIDGQPYPTTIGELEVKKLSGEVFSECEADKKTGLPLAEKFKAGAKIVCKLIINK